VQHRHRPRDRRRALTRRRATRPAGIRAAGQRRGVGTCSTPASTPSSGTPSATRPRRDEVLRRPLVPRCRRGLCLSDRPVDPVLVAQVVKELDCLVNVNCRTLAAGRGRSRRISLAAASTAG
jgi:hypothetical protein